MALKIESDPGNAQTEPIAQSFAAAFELTGNENSGELALYSPLGSTLAVISWTPANAVLRANGENRQSLSLDDLLLQSTGTVIPVAALFKWLAGIDAPVLGWQTDLSQLGYGRLLARRLAPGPPVELRLVIEQQ